MSHDRFVRIMLSFILAALVANLFRPQLQRLIGPPVEAQEQDKTAGGGLRVAGDLVVDGNIVAKGDIRLSRNLIAQGDVQAAQLAGSELKVKSCNATEDVVVGKSIRCMDASVGKMLSAQNAQIAEALSANNIAITKDLQVAGTAFIEKVAVHELKEPNDALEASHDKIIDEIVARMVVVLRTIEKP